MNEVLTAPREELIAWAQRVLLVDEAPSEALRRVARGVLALVQEEADLSVSLGGVAAVRRALREVLDDYEAAIRRLAEGGLVPQGINHKNRERWAALAEGRLHP